MSAMGMSGPMDGASLDSWAIHPPWANMFCPLPANDRPDPAGSPGFVPILSFLVLILPIARPWRSANTLHPALPTIVPILSKFIHKIATQLDKLPQRVAFLVR